MEVLLFISLFSISYFRVDGQNNLKELLHTIPDLSEFTRRIDTKPLLAQMLSADQMTLFAPINSAFYRSKEFMNQDMTEVQIRYHMSYSLLSQQILLQQLDPRSDRFNPIITSNTNDGPPLWLTRIPSRDHVGDYDYYVNNAKIVLFERRVGLQQVLYIVDDIIYPVGSKNTAYEFLQEPEKNNNPELMNQLSNFFNMIQQTNRRINYGTRNSRYTYFVPHNLAFSKINPSQTSPQLVDGHTISDRYFFSRTMNETLMMAPGGHPGFPSIANIQGMNVFLKIVNISGDLFAVSRTQRGNLNFPEGDVYARIIKPNIPVANGVIHIIENFLLIIDKNIRQTIEFDQKMASRFYSFAFSGVAVTQGFSQMLEQQRDLTVFVPIDSAFYMLPNDKATTILNSNPEELMRVLHLHVVPSKKISTELLDNNTMEISLDRRRTLNFLVLGEGGNRTYYVEGGGVRARIVKANVGTVNGFIHYIDAVLGIPFMNLFEKIRTSPEMSITYMALQMLDIPGGDLKELLDNRANCTFFVPHNDAWKTLSPADFKNLFKPRKRAQIRKILQQHIVPFTYMQVRTLQNSQRFYNIRGEAIEVFDSFGTQSKFVRRGIQEAQIVFTDIGTTNGVIQVINGLLMDRNDIYASGYTRIEISTLSILVSAVFCLFLQ